MRKLFLLFFMAVLSACSRPQEKELSIQPEVLHQSVQHLTDVIVHDIFSPPVASRIYAYASIGAYEVLAAHDSSYLPLAGRLNGLEPIPDAQQPIHAELAAVDVFLRLGESLIFSEERIREYREAWYKELQKEGISKELLRNTLAYSEAVKTHIRAWADQDMYRETRTYQKHSIGLEPGQWQPTPPAYMEAIEPHWNLIRPFVLDSASQFRPAPHTPFSMAAGSPFYQEVMEVYEIGKQLSEEQKEIASFWDCNPYVMNVRGHVMFATKKITPGGHWMSITKIACQQADADLLRSAEAYALTAITLADGFISCWDEKYRVNLIRPETVINRYIDEEWVPLLQTPPFPEYPSGHSVISTAASETLSALFGDNFMFVDSSEVHYGLKPRSFASFRDAAAEAAISRLYGGIHFMPAIKHGVEEGRGVGQLVVEKLVPERAVLASNEQN